MEFAQRKLILRQVLVGPGDFCNVCCSSHTHKQTCSGVHIRAGAALFQGRTEFQQKLMIIIICVFNYSHL
jgi:hypothetical protein